MPAHPAGSNICDVVYPVRLRLAGESESLFGVMGVALLTAGCLSSKFL
jgi:hypothetical protein